MQVFRWQSALEKLPYRSLNPMQSHLLAQGFLGSPRSLVCAPTASGKTLLAILRIIQNAQELNGKSIYLVPLKALAQEKHREFSASLAPFGLKVAVATSDFDSSSEELQRADVIIATVEKFDSLLRHNASWIRRITLAVVDEVHLLHDAGRGATLEIVFVKLMNLDVQLLALSATVANAQELAGWMNARLFSSDYRPTKLVYAIAAGNQYLLLGDSGSSSEEILSKRVLEDVLGRCLTSKGQAIVFVSSRRSAERTAGELSPFISPFISSEERASLETLSARALKALPHPTMQCRTLSDALRNGIAFHHAGITGKQRTVIEEGFKEKRVIKVIVATTTLAMGVDLPASYVIIRDLKRFTGAFSEYIPRFEVAQMAGRSGRPRYDSQGIAVLMCAPKDKDRVLSEYVFGGLENIESKLSSAAVLRMHCLGLLASGYCHSFKELFEFFQKSLFAFQYGSSDELLGMVEEVVFELKNMGFVSERKNASLTATPLGKRISELYIDPLSANAFVDFIQSKGDKRVLDYLLALHCATEMSPLPVVKRNEEQALFEELEGIPLNLYLEKQFDDYNFLSKFKAAKLLNAWINEETEESLLEKFEVPPGMLATRLRNVVWLCYSVQELAFILNASGVHAEAKRLRRRLRHGIKEELLSLCRIKGVGRVRGRKLFQAGILSEDAYHGTPKDQIRRILRS